MMKHTVFRFVIEFALIVVVLSWAATAWARVPVILSTDVGCEIDDQWAIVYMLTNPKYYNVLGIISAHTPDVPNPSAQFTYRVLVDVVENRLRMAVHPPLFEGSNLPLANAHTPRPNAGVNFIVQSSKRFNKEHRLTILCTGAATDIASAILEDPTIVNRIRVVAMGFLGWPNGGGGYNVGNDIKAWQVILNSNVPVVVGCHDVCKAGLAMTYAHAQRLVSQRGPVGRWLWDEFQQWYFRYEKPLRVDNFTKPDIIWDIVVLAYMEGMTTQKKVPRPRLEESTMFDHVKTNKTITWITSVDSHRLWPDFIKKLEAYERTHDVRPRVGEMDLIP